MVAFLSPPQTHSEKRDASSISFTFPSSLVDQVGSFNFDNRKMVFDSYLLPQMPNHTKSILDYNVVIKNLKPEATYFVPAETGECAEVDITYRVALLLGDYCQYFLYQFCLIWRLS